jgi:hypothetical protein
VVTGLAVFALLVAIPLFLVRIVPEKVRVAVVVEGQFRSLKGPGLLLKLPGAGVQWVPLTIGDQGNVVSTGVANFKGVQVPVEVTSRESGSTVRINGFRKNSVVVEAVA